MKTSTFIASGLALTCALAVPSTSSARTVYDAGAALRANCTAETGAYSNPYTDENGGVWEYMLTSKTTLANTVTLVSGAYSKEYSGTTLDGFSVSLTAQAQSIRVNTGSTVTAPAGTTLKAGELVLFPGNYDNQCACVTFKAPQAGWYSAFVSATDLAKNTANGAGVTIDVQAQGNTIVSGVVSVESVAGSTERFDFQMPVRYLNANDIVAVVVGRNGGNSGDNTAVTFTVTKEDEGAFYDSGIAMNDNVAASPYGNPYGTIANGTWYVLNATIADKMTPPASVSAVATSRITVEAVRNTYLKGFASNATGTSPYVLVNTASAITASTAPGGLSIHPNANDLTKWPVLRFRPPVSGFYSASVNVRDTAHNTATGANGVDVYLYVADTLVTNAYVSLETFNSTAHLTFDSRLVAAGEPIDIVVSASGNGSSDATAVSAIFRRDADVADAGASLMANFQPGASPSNPFADATVANATWTVGNAADATVPTFLTASAELDVDGGNLGWRGYARNASGTSRIAIATNGVAGVDSVYLKNMATLLSISAGELFSQPYHTGTSYACPVMRGTVAEDGLYRVRAYGRDVVNSGGDGIRLGVGVSGAIASFAAISRDPGTTVAYESAVEADTLWLRAGDSLNVVIDPQVDLASSENTATSDGTGFGTCYVRTGDAPASTVINVDIGAAATGRLSSFSGRGREGFADWTAWNALPAGAAKVENCREADGTTPRNVTVTLSGAVAAASGDTGCDLLDTGAASSGASDSCSFTVAKLTPNAAYTLYLYGTGDAAFTVGGETKGLDGLWFRTDYEPCFARFEATADANGEISGTFEATATGDAFSGLSLVGEFPEYVPGAFVLVVR